VTLSTPIVCVITRARGREGTPERATLIARLADAARAGASLIQIRERQLDDRALLVFAVELRQAAADTPCRIVINDRPDLARAAGIDGVHLRSDGLRARDARRVLADGAIVGRSVHTLEEARAVEREGGCDYLIFGTVFHTASKPTDHPVSGVEGLREVCAGVALPVVAIGGVTARNAGGVREAGAAGAAAIAYFAEALDMGQATAELRSALTRYLHGV
jgi:thiamine-phosphate pyrophosphorylase